jgi:hypothetical protein
MPRQQGSNKGGHANSKLRQAPCKLGARKVEIIIIKRSNAAKAFNLPEAMGG